MRKYECKYVTNRQLATLPGGDEVYHYDKTIVMFFRGRRKVLSTSRYNGGYREDLTAAFNHDGKPSPGLPWPTLADDYVEHLSCLAASLSLDPKQATGMETAADLECVAIETETYRDLSVSAIVTGGIEQNGGRVGDPTDYYAPLRKTAAENDNAPTGGAAEPLGTINIILAIDGDMAAGTLARALVTCTEAKSAALQELLADSRYSCGLATGTGTDQTVVVANADSPLVFDDAGKHTKLGELIGKAVMRAVKSALKKQSGLTPVLQHDALRRLRRFGVTSERLYADFLAEYRGEAEIIKPQFFLAAEALARDPAMLTYTSLYVHLLDQFVWDLLEAEEIAAAGDAILGCLAAKYILATADEPIGDLPPGKEAAVKKMVAAWENLFRQMVAIRLATIIETKA